MHAFELLWHALNSSFVGPILVSVILIAIVAVVLTVRIGRVAIRSLSRL